MTEFWWFLAGWLSAAIPAVLFVWACVRAGRKQPPPSSDTEVPK